MKSAQGNLHIGTGCELPPGIAGRSYTDAGTPLMKGEPAIPIRSRNAFSRNGPSSFDGFAIVSIYDLAAYVLDGLGSTNQDRRQQEKQRQKNDVNSNQVYGQLNFLHFVSPCQTTVETESLRLHPRPGTVELP